VTDKIGKNMIKWERRNINGKLMLQGCCRIKKAKRGKSEAKISM
jgi:hypothetical protein